MSASELYRFLRSIDGIPPLMVESNASSKTSDMFSYEICIHQKALEILKNEGYRELVKFSSLFSISLPQMLQESRY